MVVCNKAKEKNCCHLFVSISKNALLVWLSQLNKYDNFIVACILRESVPDTKLLCIFVYKKISYC